MQKEVFKTLIKEGQDEIRDIELFSRNFDFEEKGRYVLVGIRQAGKSYLLYQRAKAFLANNHDTWEIVYINFDGERLLGMTAEDFDLILQAYSVMYNFKPILFFDEIQNIEGWEHFARRLATPSVTASPPTASGTAPSPPTTTPSSSSVSKSATSAATKR